VWESNVDGRTLNFQLAGINNQNFIMRDEETGSWWQQVTGECVLGPLKGRRLKMFDHDELTFATWKGERPGGRVLRPDPQITAQGKYAPANWEESVAKLPVATNVPADKLGALEPRTLIVGIVVDNASKAYPLDAVLRQSPVIDEIGGTPVLLVAHEDGKSVRAFERRVDGRKLEFFRKPDASPLRIVDAETGSEWDFTGTATGGALTGRSLRKLGVLKDYWFDWKAYHPDTTVYLLGER
jgi:hypothetical protein